MRTIFLGLWPTLALFACGPELLPTSTLVARQGRPALDPSRSEEQETQGLALGTSTESTGAWLWYLEGTGFPSHSALAAELASAGVRRVYVKVADGALDPASWPEVNDPAVPRAYRARGLEVFAWSYNYPRNEAAQARALEEAARAGYQGYVVDVEVEFDRNAAALRALLSAFSSARDSARVAGWAPADFPLYATTWGNPADHGMDVATLDEFVDAHLPQTYVEQWGGRYLADIPGTIALGTAEYRRLGARKPIFHVVANEQRGITPAQLNTFFREAARPENSGSASVEVSLWRIPSRGSALWSDLRAIDWSPRPAGAATLTLTGPSSISVGDTATFSGTASPGVARVTVAVDGWVLNRQGSPVVNGRWETRYAFNTAGANRAVQAVGVDANGQELARARRTLQVTSASGPRLAAQLPASFRVGQQATISGTASGGITSIVASVDGYVLDGNGGGRVTVSGGAFSFPVRFTVAGAGRRLVLHGFAADGTSLFQLARSIDVTDGQLTLPSYFYQYSNRINPGGSCQNTAMAMALRYYGAPASLTPDALSAEWGTSRAQTVAGFKAVFDREAAALGLPVRAWSTTTATVADVRADLRAGRPVVVHGYFTASGHVLVLTGYDAATDEYVSWDPAGRWSQVYGHGGYSQANPTEGRGVRYRASAVDRAMAPDGRVWAHRFR